LVADNLDLGRPEHVELIFGRHCGRKAGGVFKTTIDRHTDQTLDELPRSCQLGRTRVGGIDLNKPRMRAALAAVLALAAAPRGFTVAELTAKVQQLTGLTQTGYTIRQAAYDLRKLRGKHLIAKPGQRAVYHRPLPSRGRPPARRRPP
jgi:hypothetical protein